MSWLRVCFKWVWLLAIPVAVQVFALANKSMSKDELMSEYILALNGESGYSIYTKFGTPDTAYGFYPYSKEFQPLKIKLDWLDSAAYSHISSRDSLMRAAYVSSINKEKSTYFRIQALNDSATAYIEQGNVIRALINKNKPLYESNIKGFFIDFEASLVKDGDTLNVFAFPVWVNKTTLINETN
jgi:hypothetical protein